MKKKRKKLTTSQLRKRAIKKADFVAATEAALHDAMVYGTGAMRVKDDAELPLVGLSAWLPERKYNYVIQPPFFGLDRTQPPRERTITKKSLLERLRAAWQAFKEEV